MSEGFADEYLLSGEWVRFGRDRMRLLPVASDKLRARILVARCSRLASLLSWSTS